MADYSTMTDAELLSAAGTPNYGAMSDAELIALSKPPAPVAPPVESRGLIGETVAGFKRGGLQLVDMAGNIARAVDPAGGIDVVRDAGFGMSKFAKERALQSDVAESDYAERNLITGNIPKAAEMVIPSIGIPLAIGVGAGAVGLSAPVAAGVGIVGSGLAFGASQFQDTKERGMEKGLTEEQATTAGIKTGLSEGGLEAVSNVIPAAKILKLGKPVAGQVVKSLFGAPTFKAAAKTLVNDAAQIMVGEVSTEMAQAYTQGLTEKNAAIRPDADPWQEAKDVIGPTIALSLMMGGVVGGANKLSKVATQHALTNQNVGEDARTQAADNVYSGLVQAEAAGTAPVGSAENFKQHAAEAIRNKEALTLSDALLAPPQPKLEVTQEDAAANIIDKMVNGVSASEAIEAHNLEVSEARLAQPDLAELSTPLSTPVENIETLTPPEQLQVPEGVDPLTGEITNEPTLLDPLDAYKGYPNKEAAVKAVRSSGRVETHTTQERSDGQVVIVPKTISEPSIVTPPTRTETTSESPRAQAGAVSVKQDFAAKGIANATQMVSHNDAARSNSDSLANHPNYDGSFDIPVQGGLDAAKSSTKYQSDPVYRSKIDAFEKDLDLNSYNLRQQSRMLQGAAKVSDKPQGSTAMDTGVRSEFNVDLKEIWHTAANKTYDGAKLGNIAVREMIQNSFDAVITAISRGTIKRGNFDLSLDRHAGKIVADDNGIGMSAEDIRDRFLTLGNGDKITKLQDDLSFEDEGSDVAAQMQEDIDNAQQTKAMLEQLAEQKGTTDVSTDRRVGTEDTVRGRGAIAGDAKENKGISTAGDKKTPPDNVAGRAAVPKIKFAGASDEIFFTPAGDVGEIGKVAAVAKLFGKQVFAFDAKDAARAGLKGNAFYTHAKYPNTIFIAKNSPQPMLQLLGHELTHSLKNDSPELYEALNKYVHENVKAEKTNKYKESLKNSEAYGKLDAEDITEEYLGNVVGHLFGQKSFWEKMARKEPTLFERVLNMVRDMVAKITSTWSGAGQTLKDVNEVEKVTATVFSKYARLYSEGRFSVDVKEQEVKFATPEKPDKIKTEVSQDARDAKLIRQKEHTSRARSSVESLTDYIRRDERPGEEALGARRQRFETGARKWAEENGKLVIPNSEFSKKWVASGKVAGGENRVYFESDSSGDAWAFKTNSMSYHKGDMEQFLSRLQVSNLHFPDVAMELVGFVSTESGLKPLLKQPFVTAALDAVAPKKGIAGELASRGFVLLDRESGWWISPGREHYVHDMGQSNVLLDTDGNFRFIDAVFHTTSASEIAKDFPGVVVPAPEGPLGGPVVDEDSTTIKFAAGEPKAVNDWFKGSGLKNALGDALTTSLRYLMPTDRTIGMALTQAMYKPIYRQLKQYLDLRQKKAGHVQAQMTNAHVAAKLLEKHFTSEQMKEFSKLVFSATEMQLHADGADAGWTAESWDEAGMLEKFGTLKAAQAKLTAQYNKLTPEQKQAHSAMLQQLEKVYLEGREAALAPFKASFPDIYAKAEAYNQAVEDSWAAKTPVTAPAQDVADLAATIKHVTDQYPLLRGDYMPLMRFGKYLVRTMEQDENGENGKRTRTEFFDSQSEAIAYAERINANPTNLLHAEVELSKSLGDRGVVNIPAIMIDKLRSAAESRGMSGEALEQLIRDAEALRINMMPRTSTSGNKLQREGVEGYSTNVMKVFASYISNHANANAGILYGTQIEQAFRDMGNSIKAYRSEPGYDIKGAIEQDTLYKHLYENEKTSSRIKINTLTKTLGKTTFLWYLSSPSIWAVQWSQPFMVTVPKMAARYGYSKALKAYSAAAKRYLHGDFSDEKIFNFNREQEFVGDRIYELISKSSEDGADVKALNRQISDIFGAYTDPKEKRLIILKVLSLQGRIDLSMSHNFQELAASTNSGDAAYDKITKLGAKGMEKAGFFMQHSETGSRRAAAIASFELAFGKDNFIEANNYASDIINDTLFDFDSGNRGKAWQGNTGHILGQFQFFRLHMLGKMMQLGKDAIGGEYKRAMAEATTKEEKDAALAKRDEARKELAYMTGTSMALAGAAGTPLALAFGNSLSSAVLAAIGMLFGDDDDPWDIAKDLENGVRDVLGDTAGNVLLKGLPSLVGMDISKRIGLGGIGNIVMGEPPAGAGATAKANWYAGRLLGPSWGMVSDTMRAGDALAKGDLTQAIQYSSPKALRDFIKASEMADHGVQGGGKTLLKAEDVSPYSYALMMAGINPLEVSLASEQSRYLKNLSTSLSQRRSGLIKKLAVATADSDSDAKDSAIEGINSWSEKNPKLRITAQELLSGIKRERNKRSGKLTPKEQLVKAEYGA